MNDKFTVSDHALVRYFERVLGFDMDIIKKSLLPIEVLDKICLLKNCEIPMSANGKDIRLIVCNNKIITIQFAEREESHKTKKHRRRKTKDFKED